MKNHYRIVKSPIGPLTIVSDGTHLTQLWMDARYDLGEPSTTDPILDETEKQLGEFFGGKRKTFDLPLDATGTEFQKRCWEELVKIPYGETWSYGEMAKRVGNADASRAVGAANGRNPIAVIVPCHRVIGASGKLVGFGGGLPRKASLLDFERAIAFGESGEEFWKSNPCSANTP